MPVRNWHADLNEIMAHAMHVLYSIDCASVGSKPREAACFCVLAFYRGVFAIQSHIAWHV